MLLFQRLPRLDKQHRRRMDVCGEGEGLWIVPRRSVQRAPHVVTDLGDRRDVWFQVTAVCVYMCVYMRVYMCVYMCVYLCVYMCV